MSTTYNSRRWHRIRKAVLAEAKYLDKEQLRYGRHVLADTVHHIFPVEFYPELKFEHWNLIALSRDYHNSLHSRKDHNLTPKGIALQKRYNRKYQRWCEEKGIEPHWEN